MDTGGWNKNISDVLLYAIRLCVRIESFIDLVLARETWDKDEREVGATDKVTDEPKDEDGASSFDERLIMASSNNERNSTGGGWAACCARGLATDPGSGVEQDPITILSRAKAKIRTILDRRVVFILERWCNQAMRIRDMNVASKLHAHLAFMQRNRNPSELSKTSVAILLISQMFLTSNVNFDQGEEAAHIAMAMNTSEDASRATDEFGMEKREKELRRGVGAGAETHLEHQLGIP